MLAARIVNNFFYFYFLLIIVRIFLTWIPTIDWSSQPFKGIASATDVYLDIFRRFIPPVGMIDFSPIVALIVLQVIQVLATNIVAAIAS